MKKIEIEKKFLVDFPKSWIDFMGIFDNLIDTKRISQTYLKPIGNDPCARIRKTIEGLVGDTNTKFHFNKKTFVEDGVHDETEFEITKSKYENYLKNSHPDKVEIQKTRFVFRYKDQVFELDVFKGPLNGLAILEIELKNKNDKVNLPTYLKIFEEVTNDERFNNFSLASKKLHKKL